MEANLTALPFGYSEEDLTRTYIVKGVLTEKHVYSSPGYFDPLTGGYDRLSDLDDLLNTDQCRHGYLMLQVSAPSELTIAGTNCPWATTLASR